jgi:hypothetical protein
LTGPAPLSAGGFYPSMSQSPAKEFVSKQIELILRDSTARRKLPNAEDPDLSVLRGQHCPILPLRTLQNCIDGDIVGIGRHPGDVFRQQPIEPASRNIDEVLSGGKLLLAKAIDIVVPTVGREH